MADLRRAVARDPGFPRVVLVHQGTPEVAEAVMPKLWPEVPAISDPDRRLYAGMGLGRARWTKLLRPRAFLHLFRALLKGHGVGRPRGGDVMQMPGAFLFIDGRIAWSHEFADGAGDHPDWAAVAERARSGEQDDPASG